jgi:hypothetical protein
VLRLGVPSSSYSLAVGFQGDEETRIASVAVVPLDNLRLGYELLQFGDGKTLQWRLRRT